jgi:hypothetical protein
MYSGFEGDDSDDVEEEEEEEEEGALLLLVLVLVLLVLLLVQLVWWPEPSSRCRPGRLAKKYWHSTPRALHLEHEGFSLGHLIFEVAQAWQLSRTLVQPRALRRATGGALRSTSG